MYATDESSRTRLLFLFFLPMDNRPKKTVEVTNENACERKTYDNKSQSMEETRQIERKPATFNGNQRIQHTFPARPVFLQ